MIGFQIHSNALAPQLCGGNRADGSDDDARQATNHVLPKIHLLGDLKQVSYLDGRGHEKDIDLAVIDRLDGLPERCRVFRQAPIIDANREHQSATFCQSREQFGTRNSVLLDRRRTPPEWEQIAFFIQENREVRAMCLVQARPQR